MLFFFWLSCFRKRRENIPHKEKSITKRFWIKPLTFTSILWKMRPCNYTSSEKVKAHELLYNFSLIKSFLCKGKNFSYFSPQKGKFYFSEYAYWIFTSKYGRVLLFKLMKLIFLNFLIFWNTPFSFSLPGTHTHISMHTHLHTKSIFVILWDLQIKYLF